MIPSPHIGTRITEVHCKSILNKSGIADWTVNCYSGCEHGCRYCYARFATRFSHPGEEWGSFVDVKVNAAEALQREAKRKRIGRVFISSVCDGWQPIEKNYGLTSQCLEILLQQGFPLTILTKSALAGRDLRLLAGNSDVEFGVTITTLDENLSGLVEPGGSTPADRLALLQEAKKRGIRVYAFLGPLMPYLSDTEESLTQMLKAIREAGVDYFYVDRLNPRYGVWQSLKSLLQMHYPHLTQRYQQILYSDRYRAEYTGSFVRRVERLASKQGLKDCMELCF
jgi:DNA repair photolyase